jgi:hypothetical protein
MLLHSSLGKRAERQKTEETRPGKEGAEAGPEAGSQESADAQRRGAQQGQITLPENILQGHTFLTPDFKMVALTYEEALRRRCEATMVLILTVATGSKFTAVG